MDTATLISYIIPAVGTLFSLWVIQNTKLKDGVTELFLSMVGKFGGKKIPLKSHRAFIMLHNYETQLNLFLFNNQTKSTFYKEFIGIIFKNIHVTMDKLVTAYNAGNTNVEYLIAEGIEECATRIDADIRNKLVIPTKIENQIAHWKTLMINSIRNSIFALINDDVNNSDYFKVYRTLDTCLTLTTFITGTGSILFNNINGAFDTLSPEDIYKKAGSSADDNNVGKTSS